ncbi:hypothetical protein HZU77_016940, partial [Neisseriaceae bacterium TC5R-5]|nr:hypothetical protein [Neisseriaceae bacterium TC5R-5]
RFKDTVEGVLYDSTKIYVDVPLNDQNGNAVGCATNEIQWGNSDNFAKIAGLTFPFPAEVTMEMVTNGKTNKTVVLEVKPLAPIPAKPAA